MNGKGRKVMEKRVVTREHYIQLRDAFRKAAKDDALLDRFLEDLLTPAEYAELATRWQIVQLLVNGLTYRDVAHKLHIATETVSRGARELMDVRGGFSQLLNHDKDKKF